MRDRFLAEARLMLKALAGGWPGLVLFLIFAIVAITMEGR